MLTEAVAMAVEAMVLEVVAVSLFFTAHWRPLVPASLHVSCA